MGRLLSYSAQRETRFAYDGDNIVAELGATNAIQRRYVYEPGATTPFLWYEGAGLTDKRWLHADERGSIIAVSNGTGNALAINRYDDWGIPDPGNIGRFQYTGHAWLPEAGLYYARARIYSPTLGRFLQTDPIGYADGLNLYNYVGSDPINGVDPTGLAGQFRGITVNGYPAQPGPLAVVSAVAGPILHRIGYEIGRYFRCLFGGCKKPQPAAKAKAKAQEPAKKESGKPQNVTCSTLLPNGRTVGSIVRSAIEDTLTIENNVASNTDYSASVTSKMAAYVSPYGGLDFKNKFRGQADPVFLAAAGNFAYGSYVSALAGPSVSNFGAKLYGTVTGLLRLKSPKFLAPNGMSRSGATYVPLGNANAGCPL